MATWVDDIRQALINLGGVAPLQAIYNEVQTVRTEPLPPNWKSAVRAAIEDSSSDSTLFRTKNDIFFSVSGLGKGVWGLRSAMKETPEAEDISDPPPQKVKTNTYRILRDTVLARTIKALHANKCQICGLAVQLSNGESYSEAHHIKPLGEPHNGPDISTNIMILCPNHHVMCDYGAIYLDIQQIYRHPNHNLDQQYIDYHNSIIKK